MSLTIILVVGVILSIAFHFIGVYAGAKKIVWLVIVLMWAGSINVAMSEIKLKGYEDIKKMKGQFADTDKLIEEAGDEVSVYEMLNIKKSYVTNNPKK
jgi:predicted nucleic-acid-binding protein